MTDMTFFPAQNTANISQVYADSKLSTQQRPDGGNGFLHFSAKDQNFVFGKGEIVTGESFLVNPFSFKHGWIRFGPQEKPITTEVSFLEELPEALETIVLESKTGGPPKTIYPSQSRSFAGVFVDDPERSVEFSTNSHGGRQGSDDLFQTIRARVSGGEEVYVLPLVTLDASDTYTNSFGTFSNPIFNVVAWYDQLGNKEGDPKVISTFGQTIPVESGIRQRRVKPQAA